MHDQGSAAAGGQAFWTDDGYDREHASDGVSRYGHYVRSAARSGLMAECWDGTWDDDGSGGCGSRSRRGRRPAPR